MYLNPILGRKRIFHIYDCQTPLDALTKLEPLSVICEVHVPLFIFREIIDMFLK